MNIRSHQGVTPKLGENVYIDATAVVIGDVVLDDHSSVWPMTVIRGDIHKIRIGARTNVQDGSVLHVTHAGDYNTDGHPLLIGDEVTIGHQAMLHGCSIGNRVLVGMAAVIMDGVVVQDQVVVAAGSLVPPGIVLESGYLYKGRPAVRARELTEKEMAYFTYTAGYYVRLAHTYLSAI